MKRFLILFLLFFLVSCDGEIEQPKQMSLSSIVDKPIIQEKVFTPVFGKKIAIQTEPYNPKEAGKAKNKVTDIKLTEREIIDQAIRLDLEDEDSEYILEEPELGYIEPIKEKDICQKELDIGFKQTGFFIEKGCKKNICRKEFEVSFLYITIDCENNKIRQFVRK